MQKGQGRESLDAKMKAGRYARFREEGQAAETHQDGDARRVAASFQFLHDLLEEGWEEELRHRRDR